MMRLLMFTKKLIRNKTQTGDKHDNKKASPKSNGEQRCTGQSTTLITKTIIEFGPQTVEHFSRMLTKTE